MVSRSVIGRKWFVSIIYRVSILLRMARVNSWVVESPPISRVRYLLCNLLAERHETLEWAYSYPSAITL